MSHNESLIKYKSTFFIKFYDSQHERFKTISQKSFRREMIKQNIYLFYEENDEDARKIDSKLVTLYMNRFIIEEDNQNEIVGVTHLTKIERINFHRDLQFTRDFQSLHPQVRDEFAFDIFERWKKWREMKIEQDMKIVNFALRKSKSFEIPGGDLHFIIGSSYYMRFYTSDWFPDLTPLIHFGDFPDSKYHLMETFVANIIYQFQKLNFWSSFSCSFICGHNFTLCKKSEFQQAYNKVAETSQALTSISSVNNDLDEFYKRMMISDVFKRLSRKFLGNEYKHLFWLKVVEDFEEINFLDKLLYKSSLSVGHNPKIIQEDLCFQLISDLLDYKKVPLARKYFFPPTRDPKRKNLKQVRYHKL